MTAQELNTRFAALCNEALARPGAGNTAERHRRIYDVGREDLSLVKLIEAHWDAIAILQEAGRVPAQNARYAVWASEIPGKPIQFFNDQLSGVKEFCSGAGLVDRALVTAGDVLVEVDLAHSADRIRMDASGWCTEAFRLTQTSTLTFHDCPAVVVGERNWYVERAGFWRGACGPAAAWAGGATGLVDYAATTKKDDPHTFAHLGAMRANVWAMQTLLTAAAVDFDENPTANAMVRALEVRHLIEQLCTDILTRFVRARGPAPYVKRADVSRRHAELELFPRQSHAERDLETLGRAARTP